MRKILLAGIVAALAATAAPASAHPTYHYVGGCGFTGVAAPGEGNPAWTLAAVVAATDGATGTPSPTPISVECHVHMNGVYVETALSASGTGVAAGVRPYDAPGTVEEIVTVCAVVVVGGEHHTDCGGPPTPLVIPKPVLDVLAEAQRVGQSVDAATCAAFRDLPDGGVPGVLEITPEGGVYVAGEILWYCSP